MTYIENNKVGEAVAQMANTDEAKVSAAAKAAYPHWASSMLQPVRIPGLYRIFAIGTVHDVTIMARIDQDSGIYVKHVAW